MAHAAAQAVPSRGPASRVASALAGLATVMLAAVGVVVLVWLVFAALTGAQFIVFKTGSMSPTMPTGAGAVVVPVAAGDLRIGDVVTVASHGSALPVTHRIVAIAPSTAADGAVQLTLRGDGNAENDATPYTVTEVHRVVFSMPGLGRAIAFAQTPIAMGLLTLIVAALVVRAFWPQPATTSQHSKKDH